MKECTNVFVVVTEAAMERNWVKYETLLALEKSQRSGKLCVALILFNSKPEKVQDAWFGLLTDHVLINVDPNRDGWESELKNSMIDKLTSKYFLCFHKMVQTCFRSANLLRKREERHETHHTF